MSKAMGAPTKHDRRAVGAVRRRSGGARQPIRPRSPEDLALAARAAQDAFAWDPGYLAIRLRGLAALISAASHEERLDNEGVGFFLSEEMYAIAAALEVM